MATSNTASAGPEASKRVLLVGGSFDRWWTLAASLKGAGIDIEPLGDTSDPNRVATEAAARAAVVVVDLSLDVDLGLRAVQATRDLAPRIPVIVVAADTRLELARRLRSLGVFYLAVHPLDPDELRGAIENAYAHLGKKSAVSSSCRTKTILIIDDDDDFRSSTRAVLEQGGYTVCQAASGKEGLAKLLTERPDLVVLDVMMEHDWAGYEVTQAMKFKGEFAAVQGVPVLMVSSIPIPPAERFQMSTEMLMVCPDSYLTKPLDLPAFLAKVRDLLGGQADASKSAGVRG